MSSPVNSQKSVLVQKALSNVQERSLDRPLLLKLRSCLAWISYSRQAFVTFGQSTVNYHWLKIT